MSLTPFYTHKIVTIASVIPYALNSRTHSEAQVAQIAASIREFGFTNPVLIDEANNLIAGHGRVLAARQLGMGNVPAIVVTGLDDRRRRALIIADNKLANNAGWDDDALKVELEDLAGQFGALMGFTDEELAALLTPDPGDGLTDEDAVPDTPCIALSRFGDIWLLGNHRLMCGDSTSIDAVEALMAGRKADLWLTDPPYNVSYVGKTKDALVIKNDEMSSKDFMQFLRDAYSSADSVMRPGAVFYIWHADIHGYYIRGATYDVCWQIRQCLIWKKSYMVMGRQDYQWLHEPCLYGWKDGAAHLWASDRRQTTILEFDKPQRNAEHPTTKPVELFEYLMLNSTKGGDLVLDSFGGSGTTIIAAEKNGRHAAVMELDPRYCDVAIKRWQEYTGKDAVLESTGKTFNAMAASDEPEAEIS